MAAKKVICNQMQPNAAILEKKKFIAKCSHLIVVTAKCSHLKMAAFECICSHLQPFAAIFK